MGDYKKSGMQFSDYHKIQYQNIGSDLRFYAEQRFKVVGIFMVTNGFILNVVKDRSTIFVGLIGILLSYFCLSWEKRTTQYWAILYEQFKELEKIAVSQKHMIEVYRKYPRKTKFPFVKATWAVEGIYYIGLFGWLFFVLQNVI